MKRQAQTVVGLLATLTFNLCGCERGTDVPKVEGGGSRPSYSKCGSTDSKGGCGLYVPSLGELIARPEWYDGRVVMVAGVMSFEPEEAALFPSTEAYDRENYRAAVWLHVGKPCEECAGLHGSWVEVIGTFDAAERGHMGMFAGGIGKITVIASGPRVRGPVPMTPSRAELFGEAKYYHGRAVQVTGVLSVEDGETVLYSSRADYERRSDPEGLWLRTNGHCGQCAALDGKPATISGTFVAGDRGVSGRFRGGVTGFRVVEPLKRITFSSPATRPPEVVR